MGGRGHMKQPSIIILCLLGDPSLPAASCDRSGGFNVDMAEILKYWSSFPYLITVITNGSFYSQERYEQLYKNIRIYRIPLEDNILNDQPELANKFSYVLQKTKNYIEKFQIIPVFIHSYYWYSGLVALFLARTYNVRFVHSIVALSIDKKLSGSSNFCPVQYEYETAFLPYAAFIFAISYAEKQTLLKYYKCNIEQIVVVGRSVDQAFFFSDHDSRGISNALLQNNDQKWAAYLNNPYPDEWWYHGAFTYIGRIKYEKGVTIIMTAWYRLYQKYKCNIPPLWIIGGQPDTITPLRNELVKSYPDLPKLEQEMKICWWGYLTPSSINTILLKTLAVVTHSQYEAGGRVIIEALSTGKPVIATPTGFAADLIRDWKNGFLVTFGDTALLEKRMEHFVRQPLISNSLGEYARLTFQKAEEHWQYYEKHKVIYEYMSGKKALRPHFPHNEEDIFQTIPDFYRKKLLYSWPASKEIEQNIILWIEKRWGVKISAIHYCPALSHHSFLWNIEYQGKEYYIKHQYTIFNDDIIWNAESPQPDMVRASQRYALSTVNSPMVLDIIAKNQHLFCYITQKSELVSNKLFLTHYKDILQCIYHFNHSLHEDSLPYRVAAYTFEGMLQAVFDDFNIFSDIYNIAQSLLMKVKNTKQSVSYGKEFASHVIYNAGEYRLLPSSSICQAPEGMDAAVFLLEILENPENIITAEEFYQLLNGAAKIFHVSDDSIYNLCIMIWLFKLKKSYYLQIDLKTHINSQFWEIVKNQFPKSKYDE